MVHGRTVEYRHEHNGKSMDALNNLFTEFSQKQQAKMAAHCRSIFGELLLTDPLDTSPVSNNNMLIPVM
jgi:hypothetical protein